MNQAEILKELIIRYQLSGSDMSDIGSIIVYVTANKPTGVGRVNEVIIRAILKQIGVPLNPPVSKAPKTPMIEAPPAIVEAAPIAEKTTFEPVASYDFGEPLMPPASFEALVTTSQPLDAPEKPSKTPESNPADISPEAKAPKGFWNKIKAKWRK